MTPKITPDVPYQGPSFSPLKFTTRIQQQNDLQQPKGGEGPTSPSAALKKSSAASKHETLDPKLQLQQGSYWP